MFLDSLRQKEMEEERLRKERDGEEIKGFRQAVAARLNTTTTPTPVPSQPPAPKPAKKDGRPSLKGIVKKKAKPAPSAIKSAKKGELAAEKEKSSSTKLDKPKAGSDEPNPKRRKVEVSS